MKPYFTKGSAIEIKLKVKNREYCSESARLEVINGCILSAVKHKPLILSKYTFQNRRRVDSFSITFKKLTMVVLENLAVFEVCSS